MMENMTRVAIIGAHGRVAQQLMRLLYDDGDDFVGIVRNEEHADDIYRFGGEGVLLDIEQADTDAIAHAIDGCDAVVFTAGAGPDSGPARKATVDYGGSVKSQRAAAQAGVRRFVQVSAMGMDDPVADDAGDSWRAYVEAKRDADAELRSADLDWTVLRPGSLTLDDGVGLIEAADRVERGSISREDVARVIVGTLRNPATVHTQFEFVSGGTPIGDALAAVAAAAHAE
jgi:uncharacterized protein YbjT (DUF2867 family)